MNILIVTQAFEPAIAFGGPVQVVKNNARELVRRGHRVTVYCTNRLDKTRKISSHTLESHDRGVRVVYHNTWFIPGWDGSFGPTCSPGILGYLAREGPTFDLIHINETRAFTTVATALYAIATGIPYVLQPHGSSVLGLRHQWLKKVYDAFIGRLIYQRAAQVIALRPEEIPECLALGIPQEKIAIVGNGLDLSSWEIRSEDGLAFRNRFDIPVSAPLILFLARLDPKKGPDLLIEAVARLGDHKVYTVLAGPDDGCESMVRQLVDRMGLVDRVKFAGLLQGDEVRAAYAAADVFVLAARFDSFPMAVVEALASGLPVVTTETCQISALINQGQAGLVTPVGAEPLANALQLILGDDKRRASFSQSAVALAASEFSIEAAITQLEEVYHQMLNRRGNTRLTKIQSL